MKTLERIRQALALPFWLALALVIAFGWRRDIVRHGGVAGEVVD